MDKPKFIHPRKISKEEQESIDFFDNNYENICYPKKGDEALKNEKHHKVPLVLLNGFSGGDGKLYVYSIPLKRFIVENKISPSGITTEKDFYAFEEEDGTMNYMIEKYVFCYLFEGSIGQVIEKLRTKERLSERDRQILSGFIAFQFVRTDAYINSQKHFLEFYAQSLLKYRHKSFDTFYQEISEAEQFKGESEHKLKRVYDFMVEGRFSVEVKKDFIVTKAIGTANSLWEDFLNADYEILETNKSNFFLISDNPFFVIPPAGWKSGVGIGILTPSGEKVIPINDRQCIRITFRGKKYGGVTLKYRTINHKETNRLNGYICKNATMFIMSKSKDYLKKMIKVVDFKRAQRDKAHRRLEYDKNIGAVIQRQLYPL